jgi:2,3-dihydroxybiphenyl 1,2-dioxygenase
VVTPDPSAPVLELAYVGLALRDRPAFERIVADVVGLVPGSSSSAQSCWRNDDRVHRLLLDDGPANDIAYFALEATPGDFDDVVDRLRRSGTAVHPGHEGQDAARRVRRLVNVATPWGVPLEIVCGLAVDEGGVPKTSVVPRGFRTGALGFGHLVFATDNLDASDKFLRVGLGFCQTDWIEIELPRTKIIVRFYHCNPRHHTVALAGIAIPSGRRLDHLMVEANDVQDVRAAYERAVAAGHAMALSLGQHENDGVESFYVATPSGINLELGAGGRIVGKPWDGDVLYQRTSIWGHKRSAAG